MSKEFALPKDARLMMVSSLEGAGLENIVNLDDAELLKAYNKWVISMQQKVTNYEASAVTKSINNYVKMNPKMTLGDEDKEFIMRLFNLNIPHFYLHLFKSDDKDLTDRELWTIVNQSNIDPVKAGNTDVSLLFKMNRSPIQKVNF